MSLGRYSGTTVVVDANTALAAATVAVYQTGTQILAELFSDAAGATALVNPFTSDAVTGLFSFCAAQGVYDVAVSKVGAEPYAVAEVALWDTGPTPATGLILRTVVPLTNAQILTLPTTPVELLPTAPSGYRYKLLGATVGINNGGASYTNVNPAYAALQVVESTGAFLTDSVINTTGLVGGDSLDLLTTLLSGSPGQRLFDFAIGVLAARVYDADSYAEIQGGLAGVGAPSLQLTMDNDGAGDLTGGSDDNEGVVVLYYALESIAWAV